MNYPRLFLTYNLSCGVATVPLNRGDASSFQPESEDLTRSSALVMFGRFGAVTMSLMVRKSTRFKVSTESLTVARGVVRLKFSVGPFFIKDVSVK